MSAALAQIAFWAIRISICADLPDAPVGTSTLSEVIVHDTRLSRPFDPETTLALSSKTILRLGSTNLAQALGHLPGIYVRAAGRGGEQADIRGARKSEILVLIDGIPISDPFFGNFDLGSIPTTDIAEVRISPLPASPLDGPAGSGGVVEVITRAAVGPRRFQARLSASSAPNVQGSVTGRQELIDGLSVRVSAAGNAEARDFSITSTDRPPQTLDQDERRAQATLAVDHLAVGKRLGGDLWVGVQRFWVPPSEEAGSELVFIENESSLRASILGEIAPESWNLSGRIFGQRLERDSRRFPGGSRANIPSVEHIEAWRYGLITRGKTELSDELGLDFTATLIGEAGTTRNERLALAEGDSTIAQVAAGARYQVLSWLRIDGSAGAALPIDSDAGPWPEGKLSLTASSTLAELRITGAQKGRLPTLRDRFQLNTGNPDLDPEQSTFGEVQLVVRPHWLAAATVAGYYRLIDGLIRFPLGGVQLSNFSQIVVRGFDTRLDIAPGRALSGGASYSFADTLSEDLGEAALDFFPAHRVQLWVSAENGRLFGGFARLRHLSERIDEGNTLPAFATVELGAWAQFDIARIGARAENLLDQSYELRAGVPGFGRTLFLTVDLLLE